MDCVSGLGATIDVNLGLTGSVIARRWQLGPKAYQEGRRFVEPFIVVYCMWLRGTSSPKDEAGYGLQKGDVVDLHHWILLMYWVPSVLAGSKYRLSGYWACYRPQRAVIVFVADRDPSGYGIFRVSRCIRNVPIRETPKPVVYWYPKL